MMMRRRESMKLLRFCLECVTKLLRGKPSWVHEIYIHTKTLMGKEFGQCSQIFSRNQLPPRILEKCCKNRLWTTPPRDFEKLSAELVIIGESPAPTS